MLVEGTSSLTFHWLINKIIIIIIIYLFIYLLQFNGIKGNT